jgi:kinesin family protein 4/21/27
MCCFHVNSVQVMKQKIVWLEASNMDLRKELVEARGQLESLAQTAVESQVSGDQVVFFSIL